MARPSEHRKEQERSIATRAKLLDAAIDSLVQDGYPATTTVAVAHRAGVSRGAGQHHFPTRAHLLVAAVDELFARRTREFRRSFAGIEPGTANVDDALDLLWSMFSGPTYVAWVELWVASRTDHELQAVLADIDRRFVDESEAIFTELFPPDPHDATADPRLAIELAFAVMSGIALQRLPGCDHIGPGQPVVDAFKGLVHAAFRPLQLETR